MLITPEMVRAAKQAIWDRWLDAVFAEHAPAHSWAYTWPIRALLKENPRISAAELSSQTGCGQGVARYHRRHWRRRQGQAS